jgi:dTDP-glucose 4,6-dehydratase
MTPPLRTYLVTGGAGFIGSNFVLSGVGRGDMKIVTLDKLTYAGNLANLAPIMDDPHHTFVEGDICDRATLGSLFETHRPDAVIHFAAESHVDRSIDGPRDFVSTNVVGTFELLEAARVYHATLPGGTAQAFRFLHVSTDEVYGSLGDGGAFSETSPHAPNSPYAATKAASDHLVRAYHHTYGLPTVTTNCSNNFGPYQFPEKLIPLVILNALEGKPLPIYGDGKNVRDWLYVGDHCDGIHAALERGRPGETYALGGSNERTNLELVRALCDALDEAAPAHDNPRLQPLMDAGAGIAAYRELVTFVPDRPGHDRRYAIDASKSRRELGWAPRHTFAEALEKTVRWYLENQAWRDAIATNRRDRLGLAPGADRRTA